MTPSPFAFCFACGNSIESPNPRIDRRNAAPADDRYLIPASLCWVCHRLHVSAAKEAAEMLLWMEGKPNTYGNW